MNCPTLTDCGIELSRKENPKLSRICDLLEGDLSDSHVMIYCFHIEAQNAIKKEINNG